MSTTSELTLTLPFPPSNNNYYRSVLIPRKRGGHLKRTLISERGRLYKKAVYDECLIKRPHKFGEKTLWAIVDYYPPDRRKRDVDNFSKALFDALQTAGIYDDDCQVIRQYKTMLRPQKPGFIKITLKEFNLDE